MRTDKTQQTQTSTITYRAPREVNIGDVFYKIKRADHQTFREPCLVCKGAKELTINGITFRCPCCDNTKEVLSISGFVVQRYRVFKISDEVSSSEWKPGSYHIVRFGIYRKVGHGYQWATHSKIEINEDDMNRWLNLSEDDAAKYNEDRLIFDDYQLAVRAAKALTEKELKKLADYNALHGTNHKAKFETENDKKSN